MSRETYMAACQNIVENVPADDEWLTQYVKLVPYTINKYFPEYISVYGEDMISVGLISLYEGRVRYDEDKGVLQASYLTRVIECNIRRFITGEESRCFNAISSGSRLYGILRKYYCRYYDTLSEDEIFDLALVEIHKHINRKFTKADLARVQQLTHPASLEYISDPDVDAHFDVEDTRVNIENECVDKVLVVKIFEIINKFSHNDRYKNICYDYINSILNDEKITYTSLGKKYGCTSERVRQIINSMTSRVKKELVKV